MKKMLNSTFLGKPRHHSPLASGVVYSLSDHVYFALFTKLVCVFACPFSSHSCKHMMHFSLSHSKPFQFLSRLYLYQGDICFYVTCSFFCRTREESGLLLNIYRLCSSVGQAVAQTRLHNAGNNGCMCQHVALLYSSDESR